MEKLIDHWQHGYGSQYNAGRGKALGRIAVAWDLDDAIAGISEKAAPVVIGTSSKERKEKLIGNVEFARFLDDDTRPALLLFGTGWGLTDEIVSRCDRMLEPIRGNADYNHLSLRVAVGIILDRIFRERGGCNERVD